MLCKSDKPSIIIKVMSQAGQNIGGRSFYFSLFISLLFPSGFFRGAKP